MRVVLAIAAAVTLSGCFFSGVAIYPETAGQCPYAGVTRFSMSAIDAGGDLATVEAFTISPHGRLCERRDAASGETSRELFVPLDGGWYIVQREGNSVDGTSVGRVSDYIYEIAHIDGDAIAFFSPQCRDFSEAALRQYGIPAEEPPEGRVGETDQDATPASLAGTTTICTPNAPEQIEPAFRAWITLGRPPTSFGRRMR